EYFVVELRRGGNHVEDKVVAHVDAGAVTPICIAVARDGGGAGLGRLLILDIADAVRPGVVGRGRDSFAQTFLNGDVQSVVSAGASIILITHAAQSNGLGRAFQCKETARLLIGNCGAHRVIGGGVGRSARAG